MKLEAPARQFLVAHGHQDALLGFPGTAFPAAVQLAPSAARLQHPLHHQAVVACEFQRRGQALKEAASIVFDPRNAAMKDFWSQLQPQP